MRILNEITLAQSLTLCSIQFSRPIWPVNATAHNDARQPEARDMRKHLLRQLVLGDHRLRWHFTAHICWPVAFHFSISKVISRVDFCVINNLLTNNIVSTRQSLFFYLITNSETTKREYCWSSRQCSVSSAGSFGFPSRRSTTISVRLQCHWAYKQQVG